MRARSRNVRVILADRPFQGGLGASLYVGSPGASDIRYRRGRIMSPNSPFWPISTNLIDPGAASVPKSQRVASTTSPTDELSYTLPIAMRDVTVAVQVRTYWNDYENETIYRPFLTGVDGGGDEDGQILGTVSILPPVKLDGGGMSVSFQYYASPLGEQPLQFALVQTSGPGSLPDAVIPANDFNVVEIDGLTNAATYGWNLEGRNGTTAVVLGTVTFTADSQGPTGVTSFEVVPD